MIHVSGDAAPNGHAPAARRPPGADGGVVALEFALIAPVFLSMLLGIIIYGVYFASWIAVTQIAAETARTAVAGLTAAEQAALAQTRFALSLASYSPLLTAANATLAVTNPSAGSVSVQVTYDFTSFGFAGITLLPVPAVKPTVTVLMSTGSP